MVELGMLTSKNEIKIGDVVQLKSGGPLMTVSGFELEQVTPDIKVYFIYVYYFSNGDFFREKLIKESLLKK